MMLEKGISFSRDNQLPKPVETLPIGLSLIDHAKTDSGTFVSLLDCRMNLYYDVSIIF